jgi:hypothetical protein
MRNLMKLVARMVESDWNRPPDDSQRSLIVQNTEDEYRLPNLHSIVPSDQLHSIVKLGLSKVTIYRGVPTGVTDIRPGDWVALSRSYAARHDRGGVVISKRVPAADVAWAGTDINEYYYVPL